jgi:hypothetical protein
MRFPKFRHRGSANDAGLRGLLLLLAILDDLFFVVEQRKDRMRSLPPPPPFPSTAAGTASLPKVFWPTPQGGTLPNFMLANAFDFGSLAVSKAEEPS